MFVEQLLDNREIDSQILAREKMAVTAEMTASMKRPNKRLAAKVKGALLNSPIGSDNAINSISELTDDGLAQLQAALFRPDRLVVYLAGNFGDIERLVKQLDGIEASKSTPNSLLINLVPNDIAKNTKTDYTIAGDNAQVQFHCLMPLGRKLTGEEITTMEIIKKIIRSADSSSFFNTMRSRGLAYDVFTGPTSQLTPNQSWYQLFGRAKHDDVQPLVGLFIEKMTYLRNNAVMLQTHLDEFKEAVTNEHILSRQTPAQVVSCAMRRYLDVGSPTESADIIERIKLADVMACLDMIISAQPKLTFMVDV